MNEQPAPAEPANFALQWSENRPPCEECRYDHCTAETPFGCFLITWKSWKKYDSPTVDETPWGDSWQAFATVELAKAACQREFDARLALCGLTQYAPVEPERVERLPDGKPCPTPPESAEDELVELVVWLRSLVDCSIWFESGSENTNRLVRAAYLLLDQSHQIAELQRQLNRKTRPNG